MTALPDFLKPYKAQAKLYLEKNRVKDVVFSRYTYQVQVEEPSLKEGVWSFLQFDKKNRLKNSFCSCEGEEDVAACVHITVAFLFIFSGKKEPLHQRFQTSLWNLLFQRLSFDVGYSFTTIKEEKKGEFRLHNALEKEIFSICFFNNKGRLSYDYKEFKDLLKDEEHNQKETSLKLSELTESELKRWQEGRPSSKVLYELSCFVDIAQWVMLKIERGNIEDYTLSFSYGENTFPLALHLTFPDLMELTFALSEEDLIAIIPTLKEVNSPLKVFDCGVEQISSISYQEKEKSFYFSFFNKEEFSLLETKKSTPVGPWLYIPEHGFFSRKSDFFLKNSVILEGKIESFLDKYSEALSKVFLNSKNPISISSGPKPLFYALSFDEEKNLMVQGYLENKEDLLGSEVAIFGTWVYLPKRGFFKILKEPFPFINKRINKTNVGKFVSEYRNALKDYPGFITHLATVEARLSYVLSKEDQLLFDSASLASNEEDYVDYASWAYLKGQGFFPKVSLFSGVSVRPGVTIEKEDISVFIKMNREELECVPGFFSEVFPLLKSGLAIKIKKDQSLLIEPIYETKRGKSLSKLRFFNDFVYEKGKGFSELASEFRLPEYFQKKRKILASKVDLFFSETFSVLQPYIIFIDSELVEPKDLRLVISSIKKGEGRGELYEMGMAYKSELGEVSSQELLAGIDDNKRFVFSKAGRVDLLEERFSWLRDLYRKKGEKGVEEGALKLTGLELLRLHAIDPDGLENCMEVVNDEEKKIIYKLIKGESVEPPNIKGLKSNLRNYQEVGVKWLWFLYSNALSGVLCDDMGLGKTHQTLALIASIVNEIKKKKQNLTGKILVVCPTSVLYHWEEKLELFLPKVQVVTYYGAKRSFKKFTKKKTVLLTSYGTLRVDKDLFKDKFFDLVVFDEMQIAKNAKSILYGALNGLSASMKLGLTGTPIENSILELKALFDLVLPGFMPVKKEFEQEYMMPIEQKMEEGLLQKKKLSKLINPFLLRRIKEDVLDDLPEKIEEISHCDLLPKQKELYKKVLLGSRKGIFKELENSSSSVSYIHVFALLNHLKQICNHPASYLKVPLDYKKYESGKWELFKELLNEAKESRQKVVVFSQYLMMLDIMEYHLRDLGVSYASIRGATVKRAEELKRFNTDPDCLVFLGSLQAVGLGVDLTAASVVIHYDRWWNAAKENQATDRVHRIGQTRGVQVFKLVTKNSFEERIDALIEKKGKLMEEIIGKDDQHVIKSFSREELVELLKL